MVTTVAPELTERVLYEALKRKNPLYQNMSLSKARDHYFQNEVMKKLNDAEYSEIE
jgi:hypothetical protein